MATANGSPFGVTDDPFEDSIEGPPDADSPVDPGSAAALAPEWISSTNPAILKKWRGYAKSSHTRAVSALNAALQRNAVEEIGEYRAAVVQAYEELAKRHRRYMEFFSSTPDDLEIEAGYFQNISAQHQAALRNADASLRPETPGDQCIPPSIMSSRKSQSSRSSSSFRIRLKEAERQAEECAFKLQQARLEEQERITEDAKIAEIESNRRIRALENQAEQQRLATSILRRQLSEVEEESSESSSTLRSRLINDFPCADPAETCDPWGQDVASQWQPTPHPSTGTFQVQPPSTGTYQVQPPSTGTFQVQPSSTGTTSVQPPSSGTPYVQHRSFFASASSTGWPTVSTAQVNAPSFDNPTHPSVVPRRPILREPQPDVVDPREKKREGPFPRPPDGSGAQPSDFRSAGQPHPPGVTTRPQRKMDPPGNLVGQSGPPVGNSSSYPPNWSSGQPRPPGGDLSVNFSTPSYWPSREPWPPGGIGHPSNSCWPPGGTEAAPPAPVYAPDSWIFELNDSNPVLPVQPYSRPPRTELQKFDGNPRNWPMFIQTFKVQVHDTCRNDAERLTHLRNSLTSDIQNIIGEALLNPGLYQHALAELHRKYGNPRIVSSACAASILRLHPFKDGDFKALRSFSSTLRSVVATLRLGGYGGELESNSTLAQLQAKLPPLLRSKWGEASHCITGRLPNVIDFDTWLDNVTMAESCVQPFFPTAPAEEIRSLKAVSFASGKPKYHKPGPQVFKASAAALVCLACDGNHRLPSCKRFAGLPIDKKISFATERKLCYRCLEAGHISTACTRSVKCGKDGCKYLHHQLLHGAPRIHPRQPSGSSPSAEKAIVTAPLSVSKDTVTTPFSGSTSVAPDHRITMLPIVPVRLCANGRTVHTFALLDSGSEITMIREDYAKKLLLKGPTENTRISTFHSQDPAITTRRVAFQATSLDHSHAIELDGAYTVKSLNLMRRPVNWKTVVQDWPHLSGLSLQSDDVTDITVLIGADNPAAHEVYESKSDPLRKRAPRAVRTMFGWCVMGPLKAVSPTDPQCHAMALHSPDMQFEHLVCNFFDADGFGVNPDQKSPIGTEEKRALKIMEDTTRHVNGRYEAGLLWKSDVPTLPNNRTAALRRFINLERRFAANPVLAAMYKKVMDEYLLSNQAHKLSNEEIQKSPAGRTWYLPHHPVFNPNKPGKCRVVFDGAASYAGASLNTQLMKGPDLLTSMVGVLLRFRQHPIALSADIVKMFLQVRVRSIDGPAFRFIWRSPGSTEPPADYQMDVQVFGAISSPTICANALRQAAKDCGTDADLVLRHVIDHFYVDNWLASFRSEEEAIDHAHRVSRALAKGGFELAQWGSSSISVLSSLPGKPVNTLEMDLDDLPVERTLGLALDYAQDAFTLKVQVPADGKTKRELLRATASVFDPLGFLAPLLLTAKSLMQDICRQAVDWDDVLDPEILRRWSEWANSLLSLKSLTIRRCMTPNDADVSSAELHVFADASERGFGAVAYLRFSCVNRFRVSFVMGKSRVAPLKYCSIPRLELCAALMAVRLGQTIERELRIPLQSTTYWTDSTTVLRWINSSTCRFHIYVANRVGEILESSDTAQWKYVPTDDNPADDCSRGLPASAMTADHRYFTGPHFLLSHPENWPCFPGTNPKENETDPEIRSTNWIGAVQFAVRPIDDMIQRSSRPYRLTRQLAYIMRWIYNVRKPNSRRSGNLTSDEIANASSTLVRLAQTAAYRSELSDLTGRRPISSDSPLISLNPFIDHRGLLCVGGRIGSASLPFDVRHPVILPAEARITELIIFDLHVLNAHSSTERTLHELRKLYWVTKGRLTVRRVLNKCFYCKRNSARAVTPMMAALPSFRLSHSSPAYTHTGVDYFGPFEVIIFRRKVKRWGCLFTCMTSRHVHLEMAYNLDTDGFLNALFRFENRRGTPAAYYSDNGTNFVGAVRELKECIQRLDQAKISDQLARRNTQWHFNPPAAPHFGGSWERLVKSAKKALRTVLNERSLTDEILMSALVHVENLLNGRPLTYVSVNPADPEALTPNHLVLGRANPSIAPDVFDVRDISSKKRWRIVQAIAEHFWRRWMREFVPPLMERRKWFGSQRNLKIDDIVVLIEADTPRGKWPLGRVLQVFPGPDNIVRSAVIRTKSGDYHRPAIKLCLIESESEECASDSVLLQGRRCAE